MLGNKIAKKYNSIEPTIKIYNSVFFFFSHLPKSVAPAVLIEGIRKAISSFAEWEKDCVFTGTFGLQEKFLREELKKWGYDYEKG